MSEVLKQTVHRILVRNAQLKSPLAWKWRGRDEVKRKWPKKSTTESENPGFVSADVIPSKEQLEIQDGDAGRDPELLTLLAMATDDELEHIVRTLHDGSPFSPLVKSLVMHGSKRRHAYELGHASRKEVERYIEARFRFLAADASCILQDAVRYPSYRQALLYLRKRLQVDCRSSLDTPDLEMELFLHLLGRGNDSTSLTSLDDQGDDDIEGRCRESVAATGAASLPRRTSRGSLRGVSGVQTAEILPTLAKTLATMALTKSQVGLIQNMGRVVMQRAAYHRALAFVYSGSVEVGKRAMVERAKQRLMGAVLEYTMVRSLFSFVAPLLWASTAWDLLSMSLGTDYARLARAVALLAQIRLLRTNGWVGPESASSNDEETKNEGRIE